MHFYSNVLTIKPQMNLGGEESQSEELVEDFTNSKTEERGAIKIFAFIKHV
jgi:hypothetical protein